MNIKTIGVEDWLNVHEKSATVDIAQSTIAAAARPARVVHPNPVTRPMPKEAP